MSLLQMESPVLDDAALGEEFTKGSSNVMWTALIAAALVTIAVAIYVVTGEKPPASTGQILSSTAHFVHRETAGFDANGVPMPKQAFDQVLVFTHVKLHNQSQHPLFLRQIMTNATLDDGIHTSYAAIPADYERLFAAYPDLASLHGKPLATDATIQPGGTIEGDFVSSYRLTEAQWNARKGVDYTVSFRYQPDLVLSPNTTVAAK